jgi:uncharacterized membrane protein
MTSKPDPMHTTVTGVFPNQRLASLATRNLVSAGFRPDEVQVVDASTPARHEFIERSTLDTKRAVILGLVFGAIGGALAGAALAGVFGLWQAVVVGGLAAGAGGAVLGLFVGRSTKSQVQEELEHQVDAGTVLVSVSTDSAHGAGLQGLLAKEGGSSMVSTPASFTAGVLPASPN